MEPIRDSLIHKVKNSVNNIGTGLEILLQNTSQENDNYQIIKIALQEVEKIIVFLRQMEEKKE